MTCIVAVKGKDRIVLGGDSAGVGGLDLTIRKDPKVFQVGPFAIGFTSSFRMGQVLMDLKVPRQKSTQNDYQYMRTTFVNAVMKCFDKAGILKSDNAVKECGTFIVVYRGEIYQIQDDFQVGMRYDNFDACGCGESYALGAASILTNLSFYGDDPRLVCQNALETAEKFSAGVCGPFNFIEIPLEEKPCKKRKKPKS